MNTRRTNMYLIEATDVRFELIFDQCFKEDVALKNPFNTIIRVNVSVYGFSEKSQ